MRLPILVLIAAFSALAAEYRLPYPCGMDKEILEYGVETATKRFGGHMHNPEVSSLSSVTIPMYLNARVDFHPMQSGQACTMQVFVDAPRIGGMGKPEVSIRRMDFLLQAVEQEIHGAPQGGAAKPIPPIDYSTQLLLNLTVPYAAMYYVESRLLNPGQGVHLGAGFFLAIDAGALAAAVANPEGETIQTAVGVMVLSRFLAMWLGKEFRKQNEALRATGYPYDPGRRFYHEEP